MSRDDPSSGHAVNDLNRGGIAVEKVAARKKGGGAATADNGRGFGSKNNGARATRAETEREVSAAERGGARGAECR